MDWLDRAVRIAPKVVLLLCFCALGIGVVTLVVGFLGARGVDWSALGSWAGGLGAIAAVFYARWQFNQQQSLAQQQKQEAEARRAKDLGRWYLGLICENNELQDAGMSVEPVIYIEIEHSGRIDRSLKSVVLLADDGEWSTKLCRWDAGQPNRRDEFSRELMPHERHKLFITQSDGWLIYENLHKAQGAEVVEARVSSRDESDAWDFCFMRRTELISSLEDFLLFHWLEDGLDARDFDIKLKTTKDKGLERYETRKCLLKLIDNPKNERAV